MTVAAVHRIGIALVLAGAVFVLAAVRRPGAVRRLSRAEPGRQHQPRGLVDATIDVVHRRLGLAPPTGPSRRLVRRVVAAAVALLLLAPAWLPVLLLATWLLARHDTVRRRRDARRSITVALPDAVDLLLLCARGGWSLPLAHRAVAPLVPAPLGDALLCAADEADRGRGRADALLQALAPLGDRALGFGHVLADHLRYGSPLVPALERLGSELRLDRRRQAEEEARRIPVRLLAPLVACVLPAFALLTVVPLLASSLRSLPT